MEIIMELIDIIVLIIFIGVLVYIALEGEK